MVIPQNSLSLALPKILTLGKLQINLHFRSLIRIFAPDMKEEKPLVSFILTYYNLPVRLLKECIDSIQALSLRPAEREVIIVDDGSDQSPMNELMTYGNDIIYVRQANGGVSTARNTGLQMARGEYVQFVDGDDRLIQAPYEHCLDIIRYQQEADIVLFDFTHDLQDMTATPNDKPRVSGPEYLRSNNLQGAFPTRRSSDLGRTKSLPLSCCYGQRPSMPPMRRPTTIVNGTLQPYTRQTRPTYRNALMTRQRSSAD